MPALPHPPPVGHDIPGRQICRLEYTGFGYRLAQGQQQARRPTLKRFKYLSGTLKTGPYPKNEWKTTLSSS